MAELDRSTENGLSEDQIKKIYLQLYQALNEMHSKGWTHGDVKLENILYIKDPFTIKLADFGCATKDKSIYDFCGTPGYHTTDCSGTLPYDPKKNDVWGLTVTLLNMVTRKEQYIEDHLDDSTPSEVARRFQISIPFAKVLLKVFVHENQRIGLQALNRFVKEIKYFRPPKNIQRKKSRIQ